MKEWLFSVDGESRFARWDGVLDTDSEELRERADALVAEGVMVRCGEVGYLRKASFATKVRGWGTITRAVVDVADIGSADVPSSYFNPSCIEEDLEKAKFASRSEAARYAANQRWKGHVKDDDDVDTPEKIAKDAAVLRGEYDDFLYEVGKRTTWTTASMSVDYWKNENQQGDYVTVFLPGGSQVVPTKQLLLLEQKVCALGARARAIAEASFVPEKVLTDEEKRAVSEARLRLALDLRKQTGFTFGGKNMYGDSKVVDLVWRGEGYKEKGFGLELQIERDDPDYVSKIEEFFGSAPKVPLRIKRAVDALVAFDRSDKTHTVYGDSEPVPMSEQRIRNEKENFLRQLRGAIVVSGAKWIKDLNGKPVTEWNQARIDLGSVEEYAWDIAQKNARRLGDAYASVMKDMGIEMGLQPRTRQNGPVAKKLKEEVASIFPSQIVERVSKSYGTLNIKKVVSGGKWRSSMSTIETDSSRGTNLHEFMHAATYSDPVLRSLENAFLERRRMGDPTRTREQYDVSERITALEPYDSSVKTKYPFEKWVKDQLTDPYAGRKYERIRGATESLTRGIEYLVTSTHNSDDDDHKNFTLGALIMAGMKPA